MTTVGTGSGSFSNNNPRNNRSKKQKQRLVRRSLLETLESRQLLAVGPQLIGVQPNEGELISLQGSVAGATVLSTSPREIVLRFDDSAGIDPNTFSGIQVKRAGDDGLLSSAYISTDLGTNGRVVLDFSASLPGQQGNGQEIVFTQVSRTFGTNGNPPSWPVLSVQGNRITVQVNTHPSFQTTAADLVRAMNEDPNVASRVLTKRLRGFESEVIANTVPLNQVLRLDGADAARVSSNLNSGTNTLQVEFLSAQPNSSGADVKIEVVARDFGGPGTPIVTTSGKTIRVEVNSNARYSTTVAEFIDAINNSTQASQLARARLVSGSSTTRIGSNSTTYSPLTLVGGDDVSIQPSYIGFGETDREVIIRFAETLPDDFYLIDILGSGPFALRNVDGQAFNAGVSQSVRFDLDLGTTIQSVVPQPVVRDSNGTLTQLRNVIHVYFNNDDLNPTEAAKPEYYQLVHTGNTLTGLDDHVFLPSSVNYDSVLNRATLTFNRNLDALVNPTTGAALPITALRLRIGNNQIAAPNGVTQITPTTEPGSRFDTATDLGGSWAIGSGSKAVVVNSEIRNTSIYPLDFPGANNEAGNRDNQYQSHITGYDRDGIAVISYNFASALGTVNNSVQLNAITETQKDLVRQIFSLYEKYLGVRFVESTSLGLTIAVGDMTAINPLTASTAVEPNRVGGLTYAAGPLRSNGSIQAVVVDIQDFNSSDQNVFGSELFRSFMRGIGVLLGLGTADELPQSTVQNNSVLDTLIAEAVYPGNQDIVHGQHVLRPEGKDIDLYRFSLPSVGGQVNIEIAAERLANSSLLDASLRLYRNEGTATSPRWVEVAANEDYFSKDPRINLNLTQGGDYIIGVSAKGNTSYDPSIEDSGLGGKSEGRYELRIDYQPPATASLVDVDGIATSLDGDGDGRPGGVFNYWFIPTRPDRATPTAGVADTSAITIWVDKTAANNGNGTLASPYNTIAAALTAADNAAKANPSVDRNVVVRILGNTQDRAYEIGFNRLGNALADGSTFNVPKNVTVMIEAGAIIKMGRASISAGSSTVSVDRSGGTLQVLGTPDAKVIITSINDTVGVGSNPDRNPPAASPGDWGGIEFRNNIDGSDETRTDRERNGLFLNSVIHADIRYGGGQVFVNGVSQVITPINIVDSRPTISNNVITFSADAAMAATPNSFREDNFLDPRSQAAGYFVADYDRVGPDIHGNKVINNTLNGLFIHTRTGAADSLESITVSARFDDIDIPHIIGENLVIKGQPGGGILESVAPPVAVVTLRTSGTGTLAAGTYNYKLVYVDSAGNESLASEATASITVGDNGAIRLDNLPPIGTTLNYVARRIYRSDATGSGTYTLAGQVNAVATSFLDNGSQSGAPLVDAAVKIRARLDGSLVIDGGIIIKAQGTRIEVTTGGNLIAEGSAALPIIFTSVNDSRFGIGGTSNTTNSYPQRDAAAGDWGGIYIGHGSSASMDNVRIAYAGGTTRSEGGFASFNPIEVHQADFRLANSRIEYSLDGTEMSDDPTRTGRGSNGAASIFVRGAQPIIVNNKFANNGGAAISIDVNSLTSDLVNDPGRMTGAQGEIFDRVDNRGALVRGNRITNNDINGMVVRGQTLTTQSVWDDTDIVHVVNSTITSSNHHTYSGLILKSASNESLVVKFGGAAELAGLVATGTASDIADRIGGSIQIIGQPNFPVVLTALADDTVGAGFGLDGKPTFDTDNNGTSGSVSTTTALPTGPEVDRGTLIDNDVDQSRPGYFSYRPTAGGDAMTQSGAGSTAQGANLLLANTEFIQSHTNYIDVGSNGGAIRFADSTITMQPTLVSPDLVASEGTFVGNNDAVVRWRVESHFDNGVAKLYNTVILSSDQALGSMSFINFLNQNIGAPADDFLYVVGTPGEANFRVYTVDNVERVGFSHGGVYTSGPDLQNATYLGWAADTGNNLPAAITGAGAQFSIAGTINAATLPVANDPTLGAIRAPADTTTAFAWSIEPNATSARITSFIELVPTTIERLATPGAWDGITLETLSNDRNVAIVSEKESAQSSAPAVNDQPSQAQYLGQLSRQLSGGDENTRLGFEVHGAINKPSDVDVYSFRANGRTEVWLDIDRTTLGLDTVVELIAADGTILALSNDSYYEETDPTANPLYSTLSGNAANPLRKNALTQVPTTVAGEYRDDYGTNLKDAGMRVVLPGQADVVSLYHIRVRSSNVVDTAPANSAALTDPSRVNQGLSRGSYQLQVRLREEQEIPGSAIAYADIRYATDAITLSGVPRHSPLVGETAEVENANVNNNTFANAQYLGNLLATDRQTISIAGSLTNHNDVDWYSFDIQYNQLLTPLAQYLSTVFDIDYADGIGRADMSMYLFTPEGRLIHMGEDSNILDDRATSLSIANNTDLSRGSTGTLDPYIGSVQLPAGRYYLAIAGNGQIPTVLNNSGDRNAANDDSGTRVQPIRNGQYIVEDRVGNNRSQVSGAAPIVPEFLPTSSRVEFTLGDVPLYLLQEVAGNNSAVYIANPFTGELINYVGASMVDVDDLAIRPNGDIRGFRGGTLTSRDDSLADYVLINSGTGATTVTGDFGVTTRRLNAEGQLETANGGFVFNAVTFANIFNNQEWGFAVVNRVNQLIGDGSSNRGVTQTQNILYRFDPNTGSATSAPANANSFNIVTPGNPNPPDIIMGAGTDVNERGFIQTTNTATATSVALQEATRVQGTSSQSIVRDGDSVTLALSPTVFATFEFNAGPEFNLQLDANPTVRLAEGDQFTIDGQVYRITTSNTPVATPGVRWVYYQPGMTNAQFVSSLKQAIAPGIQIGFDGTRVNFMGATTGSFNALANRNAIVDAQSNGNVGAGRIAVNFLAEDTAATLAVRLAQAVNSAGITGLSAVANNEIVQFVNASVSNTQGSPRSVGVAPGGTITGLAQVGDNMYAVSDAGGLYVIPRSALENVSPGNIATYVSTSYNLTGINFTSLTAGPANAGNGQYANILFGTDSAGRIHAFDTAGRPAGVFANGATSISTGVSGLSGLAFSNLDYNLWHQTNQRGNDAGHGLTATTDRSDITVPGGTSWYFGFENANVHNNVNFNDYSNPLSQPRAGGEALQNTYNFPGGAAGVLESKSFSLEGIAAADKPTLYFNYFLSTEDATSSDTVAMKDSFRVYAQGDDGQWILLVTNNDNDEDEFSLQRATDNAPNATTSPGAAWRQARVDLGALAGDKNVKLRFEFSTAGGMGYEYRGARDLELKMVGADQLADGDTFSVGGRVFEIEMGTQLVVPSGSSIRNLETFQVRGTTFTLWDGTGTAPAAGNVISYSVDDNPTQLAEKISLALSVVSFDRPQNTINLTDPANGSDTLAHAMVVGINGDYASYTGIGAIGDNPTLATNVDRDVDLIQMELDLGTTVDISALATTIGSPLDPYLRIFDSQGRELVSNNDSNGQRDSRLSFVAPSRGTYYIGVSASANNRYNPAVAGSGVNGGSQGQYELTVNVTPAMSITQNGNRIQIQGERALTVPADSTFTTIGSNGVTTPNAVPVYINQKMTAEQVGTAVKNAMEMALTGSTSFDTFAQRGEYIDVTGVTVDELGPFFRNSFRGEDNLSTWNQSINRDLTLSAARSQNNAFEGVYLDDFIIGLAERGEQVTGTRADTTFVTQQFPAGPSGGTYQLEIRGGMDYALALPIQNPRDPVELVPVTALPPNTPHSNSQAIVFNAASNISDGQTLIFSDGANTITLEFDDISLPANSSASGVQPGRIRVPFDPTTGESANAIALRVRDILNSPAVQNILQIGAISSDGLNANSTSNKIFLVGSINVTVPTNVGTYIYTNGTGDKNTAREQGQIIIENTRISNSSGYGIVMNSGGREEGTNNPNIGSVRNTITLNSARLAPGAVIMNNELIGNVNGGIRIDGDTAQGDVPAAAVPFARIVNNTILGGSVTPVATPAPATISNDFYALGSVAFADKTVSYTPGSGGGPVPETGLQNPDAALGIPDYSGVGEPQPGQGAVSLGRGGSLVVQFTNNYLTGSGDARPDLAIYEVGNSENVRVEVSADGRNYTFVGTASFSNRYIDLDAFGFNTMSQLQYVRLTDDANQGATTGSSVGADIDAVGALSSRAGLIYQPSGVGISVGPNASPTLLNNIVVNNTTGIAIDATSNSTVVGGTLFQHNGTNATGINNNGQFPIVVDNSAPLFLDPASGNLYPVAGSAAIDASIDSLADRALLLAVKQSLGLLPSPIIAPNYDITGQLRVDDPSVATPPGMGESVFKDRGASDRSDSSGPIAVPISPLDNDSNGEDKNPEVGTVEVIGKNLPYFDIQLLDTSPVNNVTQGSGIDPRTVSPNAVVVTKNGAVLVEGIDYRFAYDQMSNIIRLTPLAGLWESESVYQIRYVSTNESSIELSSPNATIDGTTYSIIDANGTTHYFELDTGIRLAVPQSNGGISHNLVDGTSFRVDDGTRSVRFEFDTDETTNLTDAIAISIDPQDSPSAVAAKIAAAVQGAGLNLRIQATGGPALQILSSQKIQFTAGDSNISVSGATAGSPAYGFQIPTLEGVPSGLLDGQTFSIQRANTSFTFEFDSTGTLTNPTNIRVPLGGSTANVAAAIVAAINGTTLGLNATAAGGLISVGSQADIRLMSTGALQVVGSPGRPANPLVEIDLTKVETASQIAALLANAIEQKNLPGVDVTVLNSRLFIEGAQGVSGLNVQVISGIRDYAGNPMRASEVDGSTVTTIFLGEGLDYGDAPDPLYPTKRDSNGPRHTIVDGFSIGPTVTADADARLTNLDTDDGVTIRSMQAGFAGSIVVNVQGVSVSRAGFVNAWIDFNGNGVFEANEKLNVTGRIVNGDNTLTFNVPSSAVTDRDVALRVRLSSTEVLGPTGAAPDGEVEDYMVRIASSPYQNPTNRYDVNADGAVSPIDVLIVVNYLNRTGGGQLPAGLATPPYLDVDGDGYSTPLDVLNIINYINSRPVTGGASGEGEAALEDLTSSVTVVSNTTEAFESSDTWSSAATPSVSTAAPAIVSSSSNATATATTNVVASFESAIDEAHADLFGVPQSTSTFEVDDAVRLFANDKEEEEEQDDLGFLLDGLLDELN